MPSGGYMKPNHPAPVSGPGALSARTDGGPAQAMRDIPNAKYGENKEFRSIESGAPMAAQPGVGGGAAASPSAAPPSDQSPMTPPTALTEPSTQPNQPVTDGASAGPGAMSQTLPQVDEVQTAMSVLQGAAASGGPQAQALLARASNGL